MKKIGLIILLALALTAGFAQEFTATYRFDRYGNVQSFAYNGDPILGLTMSDIQKVGIESWPKMSTFGAVDWPLDSSSNPNPGINLNQYIGFEMTADTGYTFSVTEISFGVSRSPDGVRNAQWRGSHDGYNNPFTDYDLKGCRGISNSSGILAIENWEHYLSSPPLILSSSSLTNYQNVSQCGFRFYMYDAETIDGDSGLNGELTISGTIIPPTGDPVFGVAPAAITGLTYPEGEVSICSQSLTVGGANLAGHTIEVIASQNFLIADDFHPLGSTMSFDNLTGNVQKTVDVYFSPGLMEGNYGGQITVKYIDSDNMVVETKNVSVSGTVTAAPQNWYLVDFEGMLDTKPYYKEGEMYLDDKEWILDEVMIDEINVINGSRSARLSGNSTDPACISMKEMKSCGAGTISFNARSIGSDSAEIWKLEYTLEESNGNGWTPLKTFAPTTTGGLVSFSLNTRDQVRISISRVGGNTGPDIIVDDIKITDYCDFYDGDPVTVGTDGQNTVTIIGGHANYDDPPYWFNPDPINIEGLTETFNEYIVLMGDKHSWTIVTAVPSPNPNYTYWTVYHDGNDWALPLEMEGGTASFTIDNPYNRTIGSDVGTKLVIGYTDNQHDNPPTVPVTLSHFSATMTAQNYVNLTWVSQTETNLMGYNVLRSDSEELGTACQICAMITATNTSEAQTYSYLDKELVEDGTYYYWLQSVDMDGSTGFHGPASVVFSITGDSGTPAIPTATQLEDAYPNPFNPNTTLRYQLKDAGNVKIDIYNQRGQLVRSFAQSHDAAGYYGILWDGRDSNGRALASGVYLYRMTSGKYSGVKKMVLQK